MGVPASLEFTTRQVWVRHHGHALGRRPRMGRRIGARDCWRGRSVYSNYSLPELCSWLKSMCISLSGCVRLWDVMRAPSHDEESMILAEADDDIACFSVGDQSKGERRLVVYVASFL